jgi:hypothetical protein
MWRLSDLKYTISAFFNPRQRWLTKKIPKKWVDKPELIQDLLFAILVNFVEGEKGLEPLDYDWTEDLKKGHVSQEYVDTHNRIHKDIKAVYDYITHERVRLDNEQNEALKELSDVCFTEVESFQKVHAIENMINDRDDWAVSEIVRLRRYLWT